MNNVIAERLIESLNNADITQAELSRKTGLGRPAISQYMSGKVKPKQDNVYLLAKALQVNPTWLMGFNVPKYCLDEYDDRDYKNEEIYKNDCETADLIGYVNEVNYVILKSIFEFLKDFDRDALEKTRDVINMMQKDIQIYPVIKSYHQLDRYGKKTVDLVLNSEYERVKEQSMEEQEERRYDSEHALDTPITYPKTEYLTGLSAGNGLYVFDDIPTQVMQVPDKYKDADFVIGVSGNSMEPTYYNGDKVAVKKAQAINVGEIGVFMIDGNGYIKEYGKGKLISHNKEYDDIGINSNTTCIGKVLGKI